MSSPNYPTIPNTPALTTPPTLLLNSPSKTKHTCCSPPPPTTVPSRQYALANPSTNVLTFSTSFTTTCTTTTRLSSPSSSPDPCIPPSIPTSAPVPGLSRISRYPSRIFSSVCAINSAKVSDKEQGHPMTKVRVVIAD
ncbi:hypothetical protein BO78DRAFT_423119 [Aspergillus sclerotiicarbonarius CBS 121057]|uniref:Uncharacterized protein n=1 Tax=Aspergillus sclerotiicarbonarius (strain CBS 121057 / IBT 28362) TaxID=1448318 RepID=A0A319EDK5_ASPSB|nr:hypothetical protein BO78DRAFT_423119 [Aspergillus sclerotiicarbonarius CBS 121057]